MSTLAKNGAKGTGLVAALAAAGSIGYFADQAQTDAALEVHGTNEQVLTKMINEQRITIAELETAVRACKQE